MLTLVFADGAVTRALRRFRIGLVLARLLPAYVLLGLLKHTVPLGSLARWTWCAATGARDRAVEHRLAAGVLRLSRLVGLPDRDCLQRSLLLYRVLSRAGADPTLAVGFQRTNGRIIGHAWVLVDGRAVIESEAHLVKFTPALCFGSRGVFLSTLADPMALFIT
jgi:hypothetical protein